MRLSDEERRKLIAMSCRRVRKGAGSAPDALRERSARYGGTDVRRLLGTVPFVIVGGVATRLYMPERMTLDTDVLVTPCDRQAAEDALRRGGCVEAGPLTIGGSSWRLPDRRSLDLIALDEPWVAEAVECGVTAADGQPYVSLPYLVLMKLGAGRMQDLADVSRMLGGASDVALEAVRALIRRYRPADIDDMESLLALGQLEHDSDIQKGFHA